MTLIQIIVFAVLSLILAWLLPKRWLGLSLLVASVVAIYWLQPSSPLRNFDFWFPTLTIGLTGFVWAVTQANKVQNWRNALITSFLISGVVLAIALLRYLSPFCCLTPTLPPTILQVLVGLVIIFLVSLIPTIFLPNNRFLPWISIILILGIFLVLKTEPFTQTASQSIRLITGQSPGLASASDIVWLGFSYLAFRLIHTLRDYQMGKFPAYTLGEFITYAIFFPSFTAGPIDRSQHFIDNLRQTTALSPEEEEHQQKSENLFHGSFRIAVGMFKKYVLADSLALISLSNSNALQVNSTLWMWVLLYAFALRIYFDFSGYTDIALGIARLVGIRLPENFDRPYLKQNLTAFWNSWHITLAQWFRSYFFNPFTRALRSKVNPLPSWLIIFLGQMSTMLLIGLWHGVSWNFAIWGAWHGLGLFFHNRWSNWIRPRLDVSQSKPAVRNALFLGGWFTTFNYVALGWVWFAIPNPQTAWLVMQRLFSI